MILLNLFDIVGTIAFAISGALIGIQKKLDLFGVVFLGIITATGGGMFRDIILGETPPKAFVKPTYCILSIFISLVVFYGYPKFTKIYAGAKKKEMQQKSGMEKGSKYMTSEQLFRIANKRNQIAILKKIIVLFDAIGLATFTITGANLAYNHPERNLFLVVCMGMITGVGGGMLRDTFVQDTPMIFKREIYAVATILGGIAFYYCSIWSVPYNFKFAICFAIVFLSRFISIKLDLHLPSYSSDKYNATF